MEPSKLEFAVENITDSEKLKALLLSIPQITKVDIVKNDVVLETTLPSAEAQKIIQGHSGTRAVLQGFGVGEAAVVILQGEKAHGVIRLSKNTENGSIIDGTVDGLVPGEYVLNIHNSGDLSQGCKSIGPVYKSLKDFHNISTNDCGRSNFKFSVPDLKVTNIIGRSMALSTQDDGNRVACGIVARSAGLFENNKKICACDGVTLWDERDVPIAGQGRRKECNSNGERHCSKS